MIDPLVEISEFVKNHSKVAVVFDLDSTLFCVSPRTQAILRQLGESPEFNQRFSTASEILRKIEVLPTDWGIRTVLSRAQVPGTIDLFHEIRNYWRKHFFSNHFLEHDTLYPSAKEYVQHLHDLGAEILYLTGRNSGSMREGTKRAMKQHGFPLFADENLIMKPSEVETDESYKAQVLEGLYKKFDHICFFENEPLIIGLVRARLPQVKIVFVDSVHSGRAEPPNDLPKIGMNYSSGLIK